jgi:hypothetical protein
MEQTKVLTINIRITPYQKLVLDNITKRLGYAYADVCRVGINAVANILDGESDKGKAMLLMDRAIVSVVKAQADFEESRTKAVRRGRWRAALG